ncbi:Uncharacterised protein [Mycobacterium tuberculosis]|nr:Uncharacterised protein [Mycobacterium tuberculosis]CKX13942.1 Uncharacterised protein [Mycobacterium tuberculosis]
MSPWLPLPRLKLPILPPPRLVLPILPLPTFVSPVFPLPKLRDPMLPKPKLMPCRGPGTVEPTAWAVTACALDCALSSKPNKPGTACCHGANAAAAADAPP